jgi:ABC-type lipoprotein export system ATPase subunit
VLVTHDQNIARRCERVIHMKDGEIISDEAVTDRVFGSHEGGE